MTDASIKVLDQTGGVAVDVRQITRGDGTVVDRQSAVISDPEKPDSHATVAGPVGKGELFTRDTSLINEIKALRLALEECTFVIRAALK